MKFLILFAFVATATARHLPYIVGGDPVDDPTKYPWQGSLIHPTSGSHTCGCILIEPNYALTSAHCVEGIGTYRARFGSLDRTQGGVVVDIETIVIHPDWVRDGSRGFPNDVAVIGFNDIDLNPNIQPVDLAPEDSPDFSEEECHISGWGRLSGGGILPEILQEAEVGVLTRDDCVERWGAARINLGHICIMGPDGDTTIGGCNGDSGGPISCFLDGRWVAAGITSWVRTGCLTTWPTVYARVSFYNAWINDQISLSLGRI